MKYVVTLTGILLFFLCASCGEQQKAPPASEPDLSADADLSGQGQAAVVDDESEKNIVQVAVGSPDHSTLVAALEAAEYQNVLVNAGPFTVFAPTNAAFDALPEGTLEDLTKAENQSVLRDILEYHVFIGGYRMSYFKDGQILGMANGDNASISKEGDKVMINGAEIKATVPTSNGIVYVIDKVLLPPE